MESVFPFAIFVVVAFALFLLLSAKKFVDYSRWSKHSRFDLYPIPKEGADKNKYGGSYFEETEWWEKGRSTSVVTETLDIAQEMLFIRKLFIHQRTLWFASFLFHFGIYVMLGWSILLFIGAFFDAEWWRIGTTVVGYVGFIMATLGCGLLLLRRTFNKEARNNMTPIEYFNLLLILSVLITGIVCWLGFANPFQVAHDVLTFSTTAKVPIIVIVHLVMLGVMMIYIPLGRMGHYAGKFFAFRSVMWDNDPNTAGSKVEQDMLELQSRKPHGHWSAPHINPKPAESSKE